MTSDITNSSPLNLWASCGVYGYLIPWAAWACVGVRRVAVVERYPSDHPLAGRPQPFIHLWSDRGQLDGRSVADYRHPPHCNPVCLDHYIDPSFQVDWDRVLYVVKQEWEDVLHRQEQITKATLEMNARHEEQQRLASTPIKTRRRSRRKS